jgi:hypothetical protein
LPAAIQAKQNQRSRFFVMCIFAESIQVCRRRGAAQLTV